MPKTKVKRCIRPQCMEIYSENEKNNYCMCGALLKISEIDIPEKKDAKNEESSKAGVKKKSDSKNTRKEKDNSSSKKEVKASLKNKTEMPVKENLDDDNSVTKEPQKPNPRDSETIVTNEGDKDKEVVAKACLYLLLDDEEIRFDLADSTTIGRSSDGVHADIDLSNYAGKEVSRKHAIITREKNSFYIVNVSKNHSVRIIDPDGNEKALENNKKTILKSEDGILLSKKILLQFVLEE